MVEVIYFNVEKWQHNAKARVIKNPHNDLMLKTNPVRELATGKVAGLGFTWQFVVQFDNLEVLFYLSQERTLMPKTISDKDLLKAIEDSYHRSYAAMAPRNMAVNFDVGFPPFEDIPKDLKQIRSVFDM
jgi:hypothetical protein